MTDPNDVDARLAFLLADRADAPADHAFADRVVALAAHDLRVRKVRRQAMAQVTREAVALAAVLAAFVLLARIGPGAADLGDMVPLASPAMLGLVMLAVWGLVAARGQAAFSR